MRDEWVELHAHSFFSLLRASTSPEALVAQAKVLGMSALALTDTDTLAGAMRFWVAAREVGVKPIVGSEVMLDDGRRVVLLAETQAGYANLCQLLTRARCDGIDSNAVWPGKMMPKMTMDLLAQHTRGLVALLGATESCEDETAIAARMGQLAEMFGSGQAYVELQHHRLPEDDGRMAVLQRVAAKLALPMVATGGTRYATPDYAHLCNCLIAIDHTLTLTEARQRGLLLPNHTYALPSPGEMARHFAQVHGALRNSLAIAERCDVSLDFSANRMPKFPFTPEGYSEFRYLYELCHAALPKKYPNLRPRVLKQLAHELDVVERNGLASFFLIIWDVVRFARERGIRCQGRGSAAGSLVAYLLSIGVVEPLGNNLLFERFLSEGRSTLSRFIMPDVDVDFEHTGRSHVVDYLYRTYGHAHVALVANHVTYRARGALRDLGKVLGFPAEVVSRLAKQADTHEPSQAADHIEQTLGAEDQKQGLRHPLRKLAQLIRQMDGVVRHLSVHSAGVLIAGPPLSEMVPVQPTTMPNNFVVEWNKEDCEDAGQIKFDALMLRTLGAITAAQGLIEQRHDKQLDLYALSFDDPAVYDVIDKADTVTLFQVESRAQMQRLPLTQPRNLEDLAVQIAIIRPGPIQSGALHPYLRRVKGEELVSYPHPLLEPVLRETRGVWLYQEQILRTAMVIANFLPGEADQLRRALSRNRSKEAMAALRERFLAGAQANGVDAETASKIYQSISYFSSYGFNKSHALSFAVIAYQTAWLRLYHPTEWYCAFLNAEPLGFYSPEVVVNDAKRHGIRFLPPHINRSGWGYVIERDEAAQKQGRGMRDALRMGLQTVAGMGEQTWQCIHAARESAPFTGLADFCKRVRLPKPLVSDLIRAGLFDGLGQRRELLWQLGGLPNVPDAALEALAMDAPISQIELPALSEMESAVWDYELTGLSAAGQFMRFYEPALQKQGVLTTVQVNAQPAGKRVRVAGMLVTVQRPRTAHGVVFASVEGTGAMTNLVLKPNTWQRVKSLMHGDCVIVAQGVVQREGEAVSVLVSEVRALTL
jgi:error-prone DNA polymerase